MTIRIGLSAPAKVKIESTELHENRGCRSTTGDMDRTSEAASWDNDYVEIRCLAQHQRSGVCSTQLRTVRMVRKGAQNQIAGGEAGRLVRTIRLYGEAGVHGGRTAGDLDGTACHRRTCVAQDAAQN